MGKLPEFIIKGVEIKPGERKTVMLSMPKLYDWTPLTMPVHVIRGKQDGPVLCVTAVIHGDEVNGVEIVTRLLKKPALKHIRGTLIAVPIVNVYGFLYQDRYLMDRRDLNRSFPGSKKGSLASRLAHLVVTELVSKATHCIDLHSGSLHRFNLPQIRTNMDCEQSMRLAKAFNVPVVLHAALRDGSLRQYAADKGIPFIVYEGGESLRFDELSIKIGIQGIVQVMETLGMIKAHKKLAKKAETDYARSSYWVRSPYSGILRPLAAMGKRIKKGELLAVIANPSGGEEYELTAPMAGIIIGKSNVPLVHEGAALFHIASLEKLQHADHPEYLHEFYAEDLDEHVNANTNIVVRPP